MSRKGCHAHDEPDGKEKQKETIHQQAGTTERSGGENRAHPNCAARQLPILAIGADQQPCRLSG